MPGEVCDRLRDNLSQNGVLVDAGHMYYTCFGEERVCDLVLKRNKGKRRTTFMILEKVAESSDSILVSVLVTLYTLHVAQCTCNIRFCVSHSFPSQENRLCSCVKLVVKDIDKESAEYVKRGHNM